VFENFMAKLPLARTPQEKMILIDSIIHECHKGLKEGEYNRPVAVNLIAGRMTETIKFLEELANETENTLGFSEVYLEWRRKMDDALERWGTKKE